LRRADADIVRLAGLGPLGFSLTFAQRALCAAAIFARAFADIVRRRFGFAPPYTATKAEIAAFNPDNCFSTWSRSFFNCSTIPDKFASPEQDYFPFDN
jgi:hypothetical protein